MTAPDVRTLAVADVRAIIAVLRQRRIALGLTQADVAEPAGVAASALAQWEVGGTFPKSRELARLARAVGMRLALVPDGTDAEADDLIGGAA